MAFLEREYGASWSRKESGGFSEPVYVTNTHQTSGSFQKLCMARIKASRLKIAESRKSSKAQVRALASVGVS